MQNQSDPVEYPALSGKVVRQVRFANDEDFTALIFDFKDNTHVSFRFKADLSLSMEPEVSDLKHGDIVNWRKLKAQAVRKHDPKVKKGEKVWITWENLDGPPGIGRGLALCEVIKVRKKRTFVSGKKKPFTDVQIRDPKGRLWWTPSSSLIPREQGPEEQSKNRSRGNR